MDINLNPIFRILGQLVAILGIFMLPSAVMDAFEGQQSWTVFALSGTLTFMVGLLIVIATSNRESESLSIRQSFLLTSLVWVILPLFGAVPFIVGSAQSTFVNAYFEAVSGITTTGTTVLSNLENLPKGLLLWRGILQWLGGLGIVIVAMIFLPVMRVGGMQFFQTEGFDTLGKVLPRAFDIAKSLLWVYLVLTIACMFAYLVFGMGWFDAVVHALTTISTGGFSNTDQSFALFSGPLEYVSVVFMVLASLPLIRFVQLSRGSTAPLFKDVQVRTYLLLILLASLAVALFRWSSSTEDVGQIIRETIFNLVTLVSGTGYASEDINLWGPFPMTVGFLIGLIGGCTGSTACSIKIFRWLVVLQSIRSQIKLIFYPNMISKPRLAGRTLSQEAVDSVAAFFTVFFLTFAFIAVLLSLSGLSMQTAITAAWTSIANIGPVFGPEVGTAGSVAPFSSASKSIMIFGMLAGRLEIVSLYVLFSIGFWRA